MVSIVPMSSFKTSLGISSSPRWYSPKTSGATRDEGIFDFFFISELLRFMDWMVYGRFSDSAISSCPPDHGGFL